MRSSSLAASRRLGNAAVAEARSLMPCSALSSESAAVLVWRPRSTPPTIMLATVLSVRGASATCHWSGLTRYQASPASPANGSSQ